MVAKALGEVPRPAGYAYRSDSLGFGPIVVHNPLGAPFIRFELPGGSNPGARIPTLGTAGRPDRRTTRTVPGGDRRNV